MSFVLIFALGATGLLFAGVVLAYQFWLRPFVCDHFGEEFPSRRDREATSRRRLFEHRCILVAACLMAAGFIGGAVDAPMFRAIALAAQIASLLVAGLSLSGAIARWRSPFEN